MKKSEPRVRSWADLLQAYLYLGRHGFCGRVGLHMQHTWSELGREYLCYG